MTRQSTKLGPSWTALLATMVRDYSKYGHTGVTHILLFHPSPSTDPESPILQRFAAKIQARIQAEEARTGKAQTIKLYHIVSSTTF